ncbi:pantoate--beta-alanine ligase [Mangrovitalea sediminis]|uniref:pantoate--beta-alanine ligase n=1 Tax=Mangrovitalea sediminis TaxID=1982043 RepID=UPI000BE52C32|nr:pantoate--beta-alanine ligase [Mangrovitalea sediminis]
MRTIHTVNELRANLRTHRENGKRIALVPTMGNLHAGHISLVERARDLGDVVVTSIFVNPMQFGANEDLDAYPRTLAEDQEKLEKAGNDLIFAPSVNEVYPHGLGHQTQVIVPDVTELHCGASRPGHFNGVSTVVTMLFNMVQPDIAVFGEKDYQQLAVIRKMVRDLFMPVQIIGVPTARDEDGLALSSRNGYLTPAERRIAPRLRQALEDTAQALQNGSRDFAALSQAATDSLTQQGFRPDYFNIVNSDTLRPAQQDETRITVLAAAFLGKTRLIDNISLKL